jgi:hypothetical protein
MIDHDTPLSKKIEKKKIIAKLLKKAKQQTEKSSMLLQTSYMSINTI